MAQRQSCPTRTPGLFGWKDGSIVTQGQNAFFASASAAVSAPLNRRFSSAGADLRPVT